MIIKVKGMHCASCEALVREDVGAIAGVRNVKVDWRRGTVEFEGGSAEQARKAIENLGYKVD